MNNFDSKPRVAMKSLVNKKLIRWGLFCILTILLFTVIGPNIDWIKSPLTPPIELKVIDSDTNKPVPDIYVVFRWVSNHTYFPGQGTGKSSHIFIGRTDQNGEIKVERKIKPIAFYLPPIFYREFIGIHIFTVDNRYKSVAASVKLNEVNELVINKMSSINDIKTNYENYDNWSNRNYSDEVTKMLIQYKNEAKKMASNYQTRQ